MTFERNVRYPDEYISLIIKTFDLEKKNIFLYKHNGNNQYALVFTLPVYREYIPHVTDQRFFHFLFDTYDVDTRINCDEQLFKSKRVSGR